MKLELDKAWFEKRIEHEEMIMSKYVVYSSDVETIVSTEEDEPIVIKEYFEKGGRSLDDYDRTLSNGPITVTAKIAAWNHSFP